MVKTYFSCQMMEPKGNHPLFREINKVACKEAMSIDNFKSPKSSINCSGSPQPRQVGLFFSFPSHSRSFSSSAETN